MSTRTFILKDGVITPTKTASDRQLALNSLVSTMTANRVLRSDGSNIVLGQVNLTTDVIGVLPPANGGSGNSATYVDLTTAQTITGDKNFTGTLQLPTTSGTNAGTIWRNGNNLEYKDGANVTKIILNSAGNLSNLMDKQVSLNNLVGTQTANRVLRSNGTNVTLSLVNLSTDITDVLPIANGGTGSNTQNFVDLSNAQTINGTKTFGGLVRVTNTTDTTSTTTGASIISGGEAIVGNLCVGGFSYLGDTSPIKTKYITATSGSTDGSVVSVAHGVTQSKILIVTLLLEYAANNCISTNYTNSSGFQYDFDVGATTINIRLKPGASSQITSKPLRIFIVYTS